MGIGSKIKKLFSKSLADEELFDELEDLLIGSDIGVRTAMETIDLLREKKKQNASMNEEQIVHTLEGILKGFITEYTLKPEPGVLNLFLLFGVNGVGKTTTIAKLANYYRKTYDLHEIVFSAGDTFRAAAIDQLKIHGENLGFRVVAQERGADPGAVIYDTIGSAKSNGDKLILVDTAGRMHTKQNLVRELQKIKKIIESKMPGGSIKHILVVDATTGQNALRQAEIFHEAVTIDTVILTKYDSTAKGGIVAAISRDFGIPVSFLGTGETYDSLIPFNADKYLEDLLER